MRNLKQALVPLAVCAVLLMTVVTACQKEISNSDNPAKSSTVSVFLTDGAADFSAVNIDLRYVEVKVDTMQKRQDDDDAGDHDDDDDDDRRDGDDYGVWDTLSLNPGVYDVLSLRNGVEAALGSAQIQGVVRKVRITLGTNNSVVKDGVTYPLNLLPGTKKYIYIKLHSDHRDDNAGTTRVWLDFDLARSIIEINGKYYLRPVIRPFTDKTFGTIEGKVLPAAAKAIVKAYNGSDTAYAIPTYEGRFKIRGVAAGTYTVLYDANNGYKDSVVTGVKVIAGQKVSLGEVTLKQ